MKTLINSTFNVKVHYIVFIKHKKHAKLPQRVLYVEKNNRLIYELSHRYYIKF